MAKKNIFDIKRGFLSLTILAFSFIVTVIFGIIGYHNEYAIDLASKHPLIAHWCDVTYSTFRLFSLSGISSVDMNQHWAISVARLSAQSTIFSSIVLATIFSIGSWVRSNILIRFYKEHYVVLGMNKESYTLVNDLLKNNEKVILIHEDDSSNVDVEQLKKNGVAIIHESITSLKTLQKAAISSSKAIIAISDNDLVNLSVMQTIIDSTITDKITCYARLDNDISYKLFEPGAYYSIENIKALSTTLEINTFNINNLIAIDLVHSLQLGIPEFSILGVDRQIQILIMGFGEIGQAILKELLLMCHFSSGNKVKLTIITDSENEKEFFNYHHQILLNSNNKGLDLWDIELLDNDSNLQTTKISRYDHIISAYENDNKALSTILKCYDLCTIQQMSEENSSTTFHYYSKDKHDIKHDIVKMFGDVSSVCTKSRLVQLFDEETVRKRHEQYVKALLGLQNKTEVEFKEILKEKDLHENNSTRWLSWENQPLFKRLSNFTAYRHSQIKFLELGQIPTSCELDKIKISSFKVEDLPYISDFPELNIKNIEKWCSYIIHKKKLNNDELTYLINQMAKAEHNRWNAFHILNNWRYGNSKNERLKTHDCLLSWENLEKFRPDTIKYDYKNIYDLAEYITCSD